MDDITSKKKEYLKYIRIGIVAFVVVACLLVLYFFFFQDATLKKFFETFWRLIKPFVVGGCLAFILKPIVQFFEKLLHKPFRKMTNRHRAHVIATGLSTTITIILAGVILFLIVWAILPQVYINVKELLINLPSMIDGAFLNLEKMSADHPSIYEKVTEWHAQAMHALTGNGADSLIPAATKWVTSFVEQNTQKLIDTITFGFTNIISIAMNLLVSFISCIYLLNSRKKFSAQGKLVLFGVFPRKAAEAILEELRFIDKTFTSFIRGRLIEASIIGILCYISMRIFKIPYAELISVFVGLANIIPFFGPFIGSIPSTLLLLVTGWYNALIFLILINIIGQLDGNLFGPKIMGKATGIDSFWVLFSMSFFGGLWGFVGMLIGIPVFAVIYDLVRKLIIRLLKKRNQYEMYEEYEANEQRHIEEKEKQKAEKKQKRRSRLHFKAFNKKKAD